MCHPHAYPTVCVQAPEPRVANRSMVSLLSPQSCVQVDGLMWITNCVFQGAGENSRAIDANTINGGRPALYIGGAHASCSAVRASILCVWTSNATR